MNCLRSETNFIRDSPALTFDPKNIHNGNYEFLKDIIVKVIQFIRVHIKCIEILFLNTIYRHFTVFTIQCMLKYLYIQYWLLGLASHIGLPQSVCTWKSENLHPSNRQRKFLSIYERSPIKLQFLKYLIKSYGVSLMKFVLNVMLHGLQVTFFFQ